ncbi:MAG: type I methionyl aminopeptidase [Gammaproteobacteria bacterium]|nr:type I methionyl aminopeptidase [Gammaproteobacteria bacterium]
MIVKTQQDIDGLKEVSQIVAQCVQVMGRAIKVGITTEELDDIGRDFLMQKGAHSAPKVMYNFPGTTCISINEEAAHGVPGKRKVEAGDIVNIDVSAEKNGYFGDTGFTFLVEPIHPKKQHLIDTTKKALEAAISVAKAGNKLNVIGKAIEQVAKKAGYKTLRDLASHGIGKSLHEYPDCIPNYFDKNDKRMLEEGMVITIEPFLSTKSQSIETANDGWTLVSGNGNFSAQFEHTMIITKHKPTILTQLK